MEDQIHRLVEKAWVEYEKTDRATRVLLAVAGLPGSGKTTLATAIVRKLNERYRAERLPNSPGTGRYNSDIAYYVPLDGYHLTRAQLAAMPEPEEAAFRRGAAFTFDGEKYLDLVRRLRERILPETITIYAPSFDHAIKDPVENDIPIPPTARIVVLEGLYVALDEEPWRDAAKLMDQLWYIDVPMDIAVERLVKRHVAAGLSPDEKHARNRVLGSDMVNGQKVLDHRLPIQEIVQSIEDDAWKSDQPEAQKPCIMEDRQKIDRMGSIADLAMKGGGC